MISFVIAISCLSLAFAVYLARWVLQRDMGTQKMQEISNAIKEGAEAFMSRQNRTIISLSVALAVLIFLLYAFVRTPSPADPVPPVAMAFWTTLSFVLGAACSVIAGYVGMWVSIRSNIRTASAVRSSLNEGLRIAMRGGAVSGLFVVAMSLLGVGGLYALLESLGHDPQKIPFTIVGYGFGASFVALFAQLGGGIYTKAADVGADLVGKVEAGIPEDDPRNPAVIADLVGDNVGDCAGRGADLFESTAAENVGAFTVRCREDEDPMRALNRGYMVTTGIAMVGFAAAVYLLLRPVGAYGGTLHQVYLLGAGIIGILTAFAFVLITQYYTEYRYRPVREIAEASRTGPATNIISGLAVGMECTGLPVIVISAALMGSYWCGQQALGGMAGAGLYGTAIATMGMLA